VTQDVSGYIHEFLQDGALRSFSVQLFINQGERHEGCNRLSCFEVKNGLLMALRVSERTARKLLDPIRMLQDLLPIRHITQNIRARTAAQGRTAAGCRQTVRNPVNE
jgi:hypothetical protein